MRIEGPRGPSEVRKNEKTRKSGTVSGGFAALLDGGTENVSSASAPASVADVGALLAVQGADDPAEGRARKRMQDRAEKVLDALEDVHRGLLAGRLDTGNLEAVSRTLAERREKISDPRLLGILDEVDLRAQVELAKMEIARDKNKV